MFRDGELLTVGHSLEELSQVGFSLESPQFP